MRSHSPAQADTIVLIHGLWMTPGSWERWIERYVRRGYNVIAPAWPGSEDDIEPLGDASSFSRADVSDVVGHHERIIRDLARPPIIMGHSFGGVFVHLLLDRGLGCAGIAMDSGRDALNRHKVVGPIPKRFHRAAKLRSGGSFGKTTPRPVLRVESRRQGRAPLLFIAGGGDRTVLGQDGWEQVADYALTWATDNAVRVKRTPALEHR
jgi:alpha-beta hydrolase superfamily lysophospholipase